MPDDELIPLGPFAGMDNMLGDTELERAEGGTLLRHAVNVDITRMGRIQRRRGYTLAPGVPLPAVHDGLSCEHFGRKVRAEGTYLHYSRPWSEVEVAHQTFIPFRAEITAVFSTDAGLYVSADQTYFLQGDLASTNVNQVSTSRIVRGSVTRIPHEQKFAWLTDHGVAVGDNNGAVTLMQREHVEVGVIDPNATGATLYRAQAGLRQVIGILNSAPDDGVVAAGDFMDAEVVKKGVSHG